MYSHGLVLYDRPYLGSATPPASFEDCSRYKNDGVHTSITWVKLPSGLHVRWFNGITGVVAIAASPSHCFCSSNFSVSLWTNPSEWGTSWVSALISTFNASQDQGWAVEYLGDLNGVGGAGKIRLVVGDAVAGEGYASNTTVLSKNNWHHIVVTWISSSKAIAFYHAGIADGSGTANQGIGTTPQICYLGMRQGNSYKYTGYLALPKVYNYALSAGAVNAIYQSERSWFNV